MENLINFMTFAGCIAIVILAIWGTWLGIQILFDALKAGRMSGMDASMLALSLMSILLAVMSVRSYWDKCEQTAKQHNAVELKIRQAENELDKRLNRIIQKEEWSKIE